MTSAQDIPLHTIQQYKSLRASVTEALRTAIIVGAWRRAGSTQRLRWPSRWGSPPPRCARP
ncbi:hypothetical protein [Sanguibacter sp. Z1732]|uniref:hypothetical protein n=1 Tax=Sanguibacter sp. Z1732 TaxID=3435412 RepID=UPI003D9C9C21